MRSLARWRLPLAALLLVGLWSSLHHALWAWPADPDLATPWLVWREVLREGPRVLLRWRFAQDNWLLSLLLPDLALFPLTGGSPRVVLLQGWAVFVLSAALLFALLRPVAGPRPAALLAGLLLLAGPPALGHVGFLTYAVSHQVSTLWGLAGLCAACAFGRRGRPPLLLAVLVCQVVGCLSDPWLGAALALPLLLAALLLATLRPDARRRALALAATVALGMVLVRARLLVLHALPGADFVPAPPAAWPARLLWAARCLAAMLHLLPVPLPDPLWLPPPALALPELLPPLAAALWAAGRLWRARRTLAPAHALLALTAALSLLATPAAMTVDAVPLEAGSGRFLGNIMVALPLLLGCAWAAAPRPARLPRAALAAWATLLVLAGLAAAPAELWRLPPSLATPRDLALADLLEAHGLHEGYGGYWASGSSAITWITGGRVALRPVRASPPPGSPGPSHVEPRLPQTFPTWFPVAGQPPAAGNRSVFVAQPEAELCPTLPDCLALARRSFGPPDETLRLGPLPILVWNRPVLARPAASVVAAAPPLPPGRTLTFGAAGDGVPLLWQGWSDPEPQITWTQSTRAVLLLHLPDAWSGDLVVEMEASAQRRRDRTGQTVTLSAYDATNPHDPGTPLLTTYVPPRDRIRLRAVLPWSVARSRLLWLRLDVPNAIEPGRVTGEFDPRSLGLSLRSLTLRPLEEPIP